MLAVFGGVAAAQQTAKPTRVNRAIEMLAKRQPVYYTTSSGGYEDGKKLARTPYDYINYEMEHGAFDMAALRAFMQGLVDGGPASTGEWQAEHSNWYRNLFAGIDATPDVALDAHVLVLEGAAEVPPPHDDAVVRLTSAGLDRTSAGRGIAVVPPGGLTAALFDLPGVRVFKPITPRIAK